MIFYITISTYHTLETRLKDSARDTVTEWRNILAINLMRNAKTSRRLKRKLSQDLYLPDCAIIYRAYIIATGHMLFKTSINCQMYY